MDTLPNCILLEEFVKEEEQAKETMTDRNYGYGNPIQEVGPKELENLPWPQIFGLLRFNPSTGRFGN